MSHLVDRAALRDGHQPRAWVLRNARLGPLLESRDERILRKVFRDPDVLRDAREPGDQFRRFDAPDRIDGAVDRWIVHGLQSRRATIQSQVGAGEKRVESNWSLVVGCQSGTVPRLRYQEPTTNDQQLLTRFDPAERLVPFVLSPRSLQPLSASCSSPPSPRSKPPSP